MTMNLSTAIENLHEAVEGRYDLTGQDLQEIHDLLCAMQPFIRHHLPKCQVNQNWDEARMAMADTPNEYKDEGYFNALAEIERRSQTCNCGLKEIQG